MRLALGVVVVIAVVWGGIRLFGGGSTSEPSTEVASASAGASAGEESTPLSAGQSTPPAQPAPVTSPSNAKGAATAKLPANPRAALNGKLAGKPSGSVAATNFSSAGIQEFIPEVPPRARRTIRGNVKVSVRVIVEQDGTVFAALAEQRGPSRYFERVAIDAAKKWTFPPADGETQRLMLVRFAFNREGATAEAVPLK